MPTPDRLPQPPGPPTLASILADHEREKRRQQRPVSKSGLPVAGEEVLTTVKDTQTGSLTGTSSSFDMVTTLPSEGLWLLSVVAYIDGATDDDPPKVAYAYMDVVGDVGLVSIGNPILLMPRASDSTNTIQARWGVTVLYNADTELDITTTLSNGNTLTYPVSWRPWFTSRLKLWGVRLGPVSPGLVDPSAPS